MGSDELDASSVTPGQLSSALDKYRDQLEGLQDHHEHAAESVREATYLGHHIRIITTYQIEIDGAPITGHLLVTNAGTVHYHGIPNQEFASAIDMAMRIVDLMPEGMTAPADGHDHHPHHGGM